MSVRLFGRRSHLLEIHPMGQRVSSWPMGRKALEAYSADPAIKRFTFEASTERWW
jgi:hypothetical protein